MSKTVQKLSAQLHDPGAPEGDALYFDPQAWVVRGRTRAEAAALLLADAWASQGDADSPGIVDTENWYPDGLEAEA